MPTNILLQVPDSIRQHHDHLHLFFKGMIDKLHKNSHKDTPNAKSVSLMMAKLREEIEEFEEQLALNKFDPNAEVELMDQANFSFLAYVYLRMGGNVK